MFYRCRLLALSKYTFTLLAWLRVCSMLKHKSPLVRFPVDAWRKITMVACLMVISFTFQHTCLQFININDRVAIFYLPASVITLSSLTLGVPASIGILFGCLAVNMTMIPGASGLEKLIISCIPALSSFGALSVMIRSNQRIRDLMRPSTSFSDIDAFDILSFCGLYSVFNTSSHQFLFAINSDFNAPPDVRSVLGMFFGDLTGSFLVFIVLNLIFSLVRRASSSHA